MKCKRKKCSAFMETSKDNCSRVSEGLIVSIEHCNRHLTRSKEDAAEYIAGRCLMTTDEAERVIEKIVSASNRGKQMLKSIGMILK